MRRHLFLLLTFAAFLIGLYIAVLPAINEILFREKMEQTVSNFQEEIMQRPPETPDPSTTGIAEYIPSIYPELWKDIASYNHQLYQAGQESISGLSTLEKSNFTLSGYGLEGETFDILSIPALQLEMPIYLGASSQNMALGAAVLGQTSVPVGGTNTNSVIAGHRGWNGADYFRYVPDLTVGDKVVITNLWETLEYSVVGTKIISPNDIASIKIQPGKDMITLFTCHPYASGGRQRFLVLCERINND